MGRPPPLRTDGSNEFARFSMQVRVPRIAREVLERNPDYPSSTRAAVERLASDIESDRPLPRPRAPAADLPTWSAAHSARVGESWLGTEWFHGELAFYRELLQACRFWETGRDPFAPAKREELAGEGLWRRLQAAIERPGTRDERVSALLDDCLWGNRVDLSYAVAASHGREQDDLLVDERPQALARLTADAAIVALLTDNTGTELALDLALAAALLESPRVRIAFHVKMSPIFVSDATAADVWSLVDRMGERGGESADLAGRLRAAFDEGRLVVAPDPFWSGPSFLWQAPDHLQRALAEATTIVAKGDANYRRLIGDALWPASTPMATACAYMPAPVLCLRTMKSDPVVGLPAGMAERLDGVDPRWRIDGRRGVIQLYSAPSSGKPVVSNAQ